MVRVMTSGYLNRIGNLIRDARKHRGWTQTQLADVLGTSQSAVNRIEQGHQNLTLEMLARIGEALDSEIVSLGGGPVHLRVAGGRRLSGSIDVKSSKNAGVDMLCATQLNKGRTT
jgi:UDP-N-acetylglucosamine 1-carboxyvinyltransferase